MFYGHGGIAISHDVRIAANTIMVAQEHLFDDLGVPIYRQGVIGKAVSVEQDVWIGANCTILGGVMIGQGTVVIAV